MKKRSGFSFLLFSLIISMPVVHAAGDVARTAWTYLVPAAKAMGKIIAGAVASNAGYNASSYDPYSGSFNSSATSNAGIPSNMHAATESRVVPAGNSSSVIDGKASKQVREREAFVEGWEHQAKQYTNVQIDEYMVRMKDIIASAKADVQYRTRKGEKQNAQESLEQTQMYEKSLQRLQAEKELRKSASLNKLNNLSDADFTRLQIESGNKFNNAQAKLEREKGKGWFGNKTAQEVQAQQEFDTALSEYKEILSAREDRIKKAVIHTGAATVTIIDKIAQKTETATAQSAPTKNSQRIDLNSATEVELKEFKEKKRTDLAAAKNELALATESEALGIVQQQRDKIVICERDIVTIDKKIAERQQQSTPTRARDLSAQHLSEAAVPSNPAPQIDLVPSAQSPMPSAPKDPNDKNKKGDDPRSQGKKLTYPEDPGQRVHQFYPRGGHIAEFTEGAQKILQEAFEKGTLDGVDQFGNFNYSYVNPVDGNQIYLQVRANGLVKNCGANHAGAHWVPDAATGVLKNIHNYPRLTNGIRYAFPLLIGGAEAESQASDLRDDVVSRIQQDGKPAELQQPTKSSPIKYTNTPELQNFVQKEIERHRNMTPQQQMQDMMKPPSIGGSSVTIPGTKLPNSNSTSFGTGSAAQPMVLSKPTVSTPTSSSAPRSSSTTVVTSTPTSWKSTTTIGGGSSSSKGASTSSVPKYAGGASRSGHASSGTKVSLPPSSSSGRGSYPSVPSKRN